MSWRSCSSNMACCGMPGPLNLVNKACGRPCLWSSEFGEARQAKMRLRCARKCTYVHVCARMCNVHVLRECRKTAHAI